MRAAREVLRCRTPSIDGSPSWNTPLVASSALGWYGGGRRSPVSGVWAPSTRNSRSCSRPSAPTSRRATPTSAARPRAGCSTQRSSCACPSGPEPETSKRPRCPRRATRVAGDGHRRITRRGACPQARGTSSAPPRPWPPTRANHEPPDPRRLPAAGPPGGHGLRAWPPSTKSSPSSPGSSTVPAATCAAG